MLSLDWCDGKPSLNFNGGYSELLAQQFEREGRAIDQDQNVDGDENARVISDEQ